MSEIERLETKIESLRQVLGGTQPLTAPRYSQLLALLKEAHDSLIDGEPKPCFCARQGAGGELVVKPYSGHCLGCQIRATLAAYDGLCVEKGIVND